MASKLAQLQSKACQASKFVAKHGSAYYKQLLENNKQHIVDPPTVEKCQELSKKLFYTRLASLPKLNVVEDNSFNRTNKRLLFLDSVLPSGALLGVTLGNQLTDLFSFPFTCIPGRQEAFWRELDGLKQVWKNRQELKVEDAGIAALFGIELYAWFCVGEIVGRGFTFTGYYV